MVVFGAVVVAARGGQRMRWVMRLFRGCVPVVVWLAAAPFAHAQAEVAKNAEPADDETTQMIAARIGAEAGHRVSPGGFHGGAAYLYRLSERDWLESSMMMTWGSGQAA